MLLLSCFSRVRLCATSETAAHQAPPSLGFSRQEHWSGLPFPSLMHESEKWKWSHWVMSNSQWPHGLQPTRLLRPWDFPGKSTGVGCHWVKRQITFYRTKVYFVTLWQYFFKTNSDLGQLLNCLSFLISNELIHRKCVEKCLVHSKQSVNITCYVCIYIHYIIYAKCINW